MSLSRKILSSFLVCFGIILLTIDGLEGRWYRNPFLDSEVEDSTTLNINNERGLGWKTWFIICSVTFIFILIFYGYKFYYVCQLYMHERDLFYRQMEN